MEAITYPWQRLWVPGNSAEGLLAPNTYFISPVEAAPLEHWHDVPCLILLGEPGMGKSAEWKRQPVLPGASSFLNLGDFGSGQQIQQELPELPAMQQWLRQPAEGFWLWLDSYDEALLDEAKLAPTLLRLLARWPTTGLHLRILCRTATWPAFLTTELARHFGNEQSVAVLQLAPLTREQVHQAAEAHDIVAEDFEMAVARAEAVALASRPVTLQLLLKLWLASEFSADTGRGTDLLEKGCRLLCAEHWDDTRRNYRHADPERRFRLAAQLALLMVMGGRRVLTFDETDDGHHRLRLRDITDQPLLFADRSDPVPDYEAVISLLQDSGLFVADANQARWTHPVFADYLAAWALHHAAIAPGQVRNLLRAEVPEAGLVPALRDMGVWLAALSPDFATDLVQLDPLTAVRADVLTANDTQRAGLVAQLLTLATTRHLYPYRTEAYLNRLTHPGLAAQLTEVLRDAAAPLEARQLAHQLAVSGQVRAMIPLLVEQALDEQLPLGTRTEALQSLRLLASPAECAELRVLLAVIPATDQDDEFRGALLPLLWPHALALTELLPLLTPRRNDSLAGNYYAFVDPTYTGGFRSGLTAAHLPQLLRWLVRQHPAAYAANPWVSDSLRTAAQQLAWQHTADPAILPWLALAIRRWLAHYELKLLPAEAEPRQRVLSCWVSRHCLPRTWELFHNFPVLYSEDELQASQQQAMVDEADFDFIIAQLRDMQHPATASRLTDIALELLYNALDQPDFQAKFSTLYTLQQEQQLATNHAWQLDLDGPQVKNARKGVRQQRLRQRAQRRKVRQVRRWNYRTPRLLLRLTDLHRPNPARNWLLVWWLLTRRGDGKPNNLSTEIHQGSGWLRAPSSMRTRIVALARRVVLESPPQSADGEPYDTFTSRQAAALSALLLCLDERPQDMAALTAAQWEPWLRAAVVGWLAPERRAALFGVALQHHRRAVRRLLAGGMPDFWAKIAADPHGYIRVKELLRDIPDETLQGLVLRAVRLGRWPHHFSQELFTHLLQLGFKPAKLFRDGLLIQASAAPYWHVLTLSAFRSVLSSAQPVFDWWQAWLYLIQLGTETARYLLPRLDRRLSWASLFPAALPDEHLVALLVWLVRQLHIVEESESPDWQAGTDRGWLRTFRQSVVNVLAERATPVTWHALQELATELHLPRWLAYALNEARETYCRRVWQAPAPAQLLAFLRQAARRWPHSSADLLDLVLESLDRYQAQLQGEPARAQALWYPVSQRTGYRIVRGHKLVTENEVTDNVKAFLDDDLVHHLFSTHREVQLRAAAGNQQGQELDLYVQAVPVDERGQPQSGERLLVFIEAKHQDNPEVATALQSQLVGRYLHQHEARTGLFLVYWFKPQASAELTALRQQLTEQAQRASVDGLIIKSYVLDIRMPDDQ